MESQENSFFWKLIMLLSSLLRYFLYLLSLISFLLVYNEGKDYDPKREPADTTNLELLLISAILFLIAGLLIKILENQSLNDKSNKNQN